MKKGLSSEGSESGTGSVAVWIPPTLPPPSSRGRGRAERKGRFVRISQVARDLCEVSLLLPLPSPTLERRPRR